MPQHDRALVKERARRLREKGDAALAAHLQEQVGTRQRVLIESRDMGRTEQFLPVRVNSPGVAGAITEVSISGHNGRQLLAA
jgi:threonylcarbamoyladenosine tRNA methylthiotransferase MtaB